MEKIKQYEKDEVQALKHAVDLLHPDEKDKLLLKLLCMKLR